MVSAEQYLTECHPEVRAEDGVDDGIEETVEVAEPQHEAEQQLWVVAAGAAEGAHDGDDEERQIAADEGAGDDGERARGLALALLLQLLLRAVLAVRRAALLVEQALGDVEQAASGAQTRRRLHGARDVLVVAVRVAVFAAVRRRLRRCRRRARRHRVDGRRRLARRRRRLEPLLADARLRRLVDFHVDEDHEEGRHVEGAESREDGVSPVLADEAHDGRLARRVRLVLPADERRQRYAHRHRPAECDHSQNPLRRPVLDVVDARHGPVAVERDGDEMEYRRRAAQHVDEDPRVAHFRSHKPLRAHLLNGGERHDECCHHEVCDGERRDQIVGDAVEIAFKNDGCDDEHVSDDRR